MLMSVMMLGNKGVAGMATSSWNVVPGVRKPVFFPKNTAQSTLESGVLTQQRWRQNIRYFFKKYCLEYSGVPLGGKLSKMAALESVFLKKLPIGDLLKVEQQVLIVSISLCKFKMCCL